MFSGDVAAYHFSTDTITIVSQNWAVLGFWGKFYTLLHEFSHHEWRGLPLYVHDKFLHSKLESKIGHLFDSNL